MTPLVNGRLQSVDPDQFPEWCMLSTSFQSASSHSEEFDAVNNFFTGIGITVSKLSSPQEQPFLGTATRLAFEIATVFATYPSLRDHFRRAVNRIMVCCCEGPTVYQLTGNTLQLYQNNVDWIFDDVLAVVLRVIGRSMFQRSERAFQEQYIWWHANGGAINPRWTAEDEVAELVVIQVCGFEWRWRQISCQLCDSDALRRRRSWIEDLCTTYGL